MFLHGFVSEVVPRLLAEFNILGAEDVAEW